MKVAWIFPGQGSQEVGMGRDVAAAFATSKAVFESADGAFARAGDERSLTSLCFEGPIEALTLTENTQPALVATQAALVAAIREAHPELAAPVVAMGHSLGEYAALVAAGALSLSDAVRLCRVRGAAMQAAVPAGAGAMAAVIGTDDGVILAACAEASEAGSPVSPANFNAPGQTVIAGSSEAVKRATELLAARGAKTIPLKVSAPFHCALMRPAAAELDRALAAVTLGAMQFPVIANVDAAPNDDPARVKDLLVRQVDGPVLWIKCVERAVALGVEVMVEIGPGKVLAGLIKRIDKKIRVVSVSDAASVAGLAGALSG
jgi:[acyl-carrier-protein] S-malonyltransferase